MAGPGALNVRCQLCGAPAPIEKWQADYEKIREHGDEPYICEPCQAKIQREAARDGR
jgi:uncharacterized protein YlaI